MPVMGCLWRTVYSSSDADSEAWQVLKYVRGEGESIAKMTVYGRVLFKQRDIDKLENTLKERQDIMSHLLVQDIW